MASLVRFKIIIYKPETPAIKKLGTYCTAMIQRNCHIGHNQYRDALRDAAITIYQPIRG